MKENGMVAKLESETTEEAAETVTEVADDINKGEKDEIVRLLIEVGVCKLCALNFSSNSNQHGNGIMATYGDYDCDIDALDNATHCYLCLGILEDFNLCDAAKKISEKMEDLKYDSPDFSMGVVIPKCTFLRRSSILAYLAEKTSSPKYNESKSMALLKNVVKFFLSKLVMKFSKKTLVANSKLFIEVKYMYSDDQTELSELDAFNMLTKKRKLESNSDNMKKVSFSSMVSNLTKSNIKECTIYPPKFSPKSCTFEISVLHSNIYLGGCFNRYSRTLSSTWEDGAAQDFIGEKLKERTQASGIKFISSGSEEVDVKVLGEGKPFAVVLTNPKRCSFLEQDQLFKLQEEVKSSETMAVHSLQKVSKAGLELMKSGEDGKVKTYKAKLFCSHHISEKTLENLNCMKDIVLKQATPIRLLHLKPSENKENTIYQIELKKVDDHYELMLDVSGGSYVKEFIHGDLGRTEPSLCSLLDNATIELSELDFMGMNLNWPPRIDSI